MDCVVTGLQVEPIILASVNNNTSYLAIVTLPTPSAMNIPYC